MFKKSFISASVLALLCSTNLRGQQTQSGQPAQPTSSVYNRMRRVPQQNGSDSQQQPTVQSQQFPNPQQFPPEQQGTPTQGQRPPMTFPHASQPPNQPVTPPAATQNPQSSPSQPTPAPQTPETPSGLELKPANPPRVSYAGTQLTVVADNSSLADILSAVGKATGAHLEGAQPDSERVFGQFGPGTPRQVLNLLLTGSHYDFILMGAVDNPGGVQRIMLSQHGASPLGISEASNKAEARQKVPTAQPQEDEEANEAANPAPTPEPPPPPPQANQAEQQSQQGTQPQVKTPEQLLQELQRLRQQQQQQQANQPTPR